ncbi:hypothetical protein [Phocaeicola vulgatus]|uniref:Uncharacterized protein n=1 Tax=Phocaeicola vulgatus TaxID=821 RepID=A0AAP6YB96_PHOVU|nr:hypothetical protein [Phocaeicola vulgatus]KAB5456217.1 hypothetical protein F9001_04060 [Phocaeicola vulgatus]MDB0826194.1 hypothetical protein [Phocaeicola vulgatus]MDB0843654.1 hypothetical protein [Phocaeicola vulgatus]MDB0848188.1 hypothetical protein [Phocaeicola vulgatus]MDB0851864.1 hypothetical protein [Phocaeicola vulgatus]
MNEGSGNQSGGKGRYLWRKPPWIRYLWRNLFENERLSLGNPIFGEIILGYSIFEETSLKTNGSHWKPYLWRNHPWIRYLWRNLFENERFSLETLSLEKSSLNTVSLKKPL